MTGNTRGQPDTRRRDRRSITDEKSEKRRMKKLDSNN